MTHSKNILILLCLFFLWIISIPLACLPGPMSISATNVVHILYNFLSMQPIPEVTNTLLNHQDMTQYLVVTQIRFARVMLAIFCGGALAVAGVVLQGVLRNALADPFTLGISAGAACGASIALTLGAPAVAALTGFFGTQILQSLGGITAFFAFTGALLALAMALILGGSGGLFAYRKYAGNMASSINQRENIVLAGIAVSTFLGAVVALIKALNEESVTSIVFWIMGSFQGRTWDTLPLLLIPLVPGFLCIALYWRELDILALGQRQAAQLGLNVTKVRLILLVAASAITAGCVAVAGVIAFVGLVVPHILRMCYSYVFFQSSQKSSLQKKKVHHAGHGTLLISAFLGGGLLLVWADVLARTLLSDGQELPVGVVTSLLGGPFFAFLIRHKNSV